MPRRTRKRKDTTPPQPIRLDTLPRDANLIIEGGMRPLGLFLREHGRTVQPRMAIWVDYDSGLIRSSSLLSPDDADDDCVLGALEALQMALALPESPDNELVDLALGGVGETDDSETQVADDGDAELSEFERHRRARQAQQAQQAQQDGQPASSQQTPASYPGRRRPPMQAALPALVRVNDERLAEAARALLEPLEVVVEYAAELPHFEQVYDALAQSLGADPDPNPAPPEPFTWDVDPALLPPLFKAAADLWRRGPWDFLPDVPPLAIELGKYGPQDDTPTLYVTTIGGAGEVIGAVLHYSTEAVENTLRHGEEMLERAESLEISDEQLGEVIALLRQTGLPVDMLPPEQIRQVARDAMLAGMQESGDLDDDEDPLALTEDALAIFFESPDEIDPTYLEWLDTHAIKYSKRTNIPAFYRMTRGIGSRAPTTRETQALLLALTALNQFYNAHHSRLEDFETLARQEPTLTTDATVSPGGAEASSAGKSAGKQGGKGGAKANAQGNTKAGAKPGDREKQAPADERIRVRVTYPAPGYTFARFGLDVPSQDDDEDDDEDGGNDNVLLNFPFTFGAAGDLNDDTSDENGDDGLGDEE